MVECSEQDLLLLLTFRVPSKASLSAFLILLPSLLHQPQRLPSGGGQSPAGRPERGPPGDAPKEEEELATEDRCNYHSGKAKMGWRCKQPKLKGFKICKFHRCGKYPAMCPDDVSKYARGTRVSRVVA
jgi:hypothetical protein